MRKDAVTLVELLIAIVIIAILAAIAVPVYTGKIERTKGERAIANIELIKDAFEMYYIKHESYPPQGSVDSLSEINTTLGLDLNDPNFNYSMNLIVLGGIPIRIIAERNSGIYNHSTILYNLRDAPPEMIGWSGSSTWPWRPQN